MKGKYIRERKPVDLYHCRIHITAVLQVFFLCVRGLTRKSLNVCLIYRVVKKS